MIDTRASLDAVVRHVTDPDGEQDYLDIEPTVTALANSGDLSLVPALEETLTRFLDAGDFYGRDLVAGILAGIAGPTALPTLLRAAARDLGDDQDGLSADIAGLLDADPAAGRAAADGFAQSADPALRRVGLWALGFVVDDGDAAPFETALADPDPEVRSLAVDGVPIGAGFDVLVAALRDVSEQVRVSAASRLGGAGRVEAVPPLADLAGDPATRVRAMAAYALGRIGHESAAPALLRLARDDDRGVRENAVQALGRAGGERAVDALLDLAGHPDPEQRIAAAKALPAAVRSDPRAADAVEQLAADPIPEVRTATLSGLASTMERTPLGDHILRRLAADPDPGVRQRVAVLQRLAGRPRP